LRADQRTQALYKGEVADAERHGPLDFYRQRRFGGTTTTWGGRCAPFDPMDFERRDHVPDSGWPISRAHLEPYYARAHQYLHLGEFSYDAARLPAGRHPMVPGLPSDRVRQDTMWRFSLPTNMAREFGGILKQSRRATVHLHANCSKVVTNDEGTAVTALEVASLSRNRYRVEAEFYVLATGGLEAIRLLLVSTDRHTNGLGNAHGLVGRFYSSHVTGELGKVQFLPVGRPIIWDYERDADSVYVRRNLSIVEDVQRAEGLMNFRCTLASPPADDPSHRNGVLSAVYLAKRFLVRRIPPEFSKELASPMAPYRKVMQHSRNVVLGAPQLARFSVKLLRDRILPERKLPSIMLPSPTNVYSLHFDAEQGPNPESRVTLSEARDAFGTRRLRVDWRYSDRDVASAVRSFEILRSEIERSGVGRVSEPVGGVADAIHRGVSVGSHHIGGTRMASEPARGVVDAECRVHGVANLFIASSSVFPTTSYANPTLTITALALRIADRIRELRGRASPEVSRSRDDVDLEP
jgi:choline dehydrogenase-like flavoprotein